MEWTAEHDDEYSELMEEFPRWLPALERAVLVEDQIAEIMRRLSELEESMRNPLLESIRQRLGAKNAGQ